MSYKTSFVTKKLYNNEIEKLIIKNGYLPNQEKIKRAKEKKKILKQQLLDAITPKGQLDFNSMAEYEEKKKQFDRKFSPKLEDAVRSMNRAKDNLMDILKCNEFNFFVTLTFNNEKKDRLDDKETRKIFVNWVNYIQKLFSSFYYVAVPEYHKKGGLHFHLLIGGVSAEDIKLEDSGKKVKTGRCKGQIIYNVKRWEKKGFSTATKILDNIAVTYYLSKYLTKGKIDPRFYNKKRYYTSKNIKRPQISKIQVPLVNGFDVFDSIQKEDYNVDYEDKQKEYCVLSRSLKE